MFKSLTPTLSIITAIVLFVFFTQPQLDKIDALGAEIEDYQTTIKDYETFNAKVDSLKATKESINLADRDRLDVLVPKTVDETRLLVDLEVMAKKHELLFGNITTSVGNVDFSPEKTSGTKKVSTNVVGYSVSFEVIGTYEQFKAMLKDIESSLTFMEVTEMSLAAAAADFQQYSLTVQTYALPASN